MQALELSKVLKSVHLVLPHIQYDRYKHSEQTAAYQALPKEINPINTLVNL